MSLLIDQRKPDGVTIVHLNGRIVLGDEAARLVETVKNLAAAGENRILLNLGEVTYVDSRGLGTLVRSYQAVTQEQGQLKLLCVPSRIQTLPSEFPL